MNLPSIKGEIIITSHGTADSQFIVFEHDGQFLSPQELVDKYNDIFDSRPSDAIRLYVCDAGNGDNNFIEQLSEILEGRDIYAPDGKIQLYDNGYVSMEGSTWVVKHKKK